MIAKAVGDTRFDGISVIGECTHPREPGLRNGALDHE